MSGVGISFGIDRIFDVMNELDLFKDKLKDVASVQILFLNLGDAEQAHIISLLSKLRKEGIAAEIYPDQTKEKKQFDYAVKKKIPYICTISHEEISSGQYTVKNMESRQQHKGDLNHIIQILKN